MAMRSQLTTTLLFVLIFTLVLATAIQLADRPTASRQTLTRSPYLTQFSERDPWISRHARLSRAFLKQRRRLESFSRWVWDLVVVPEVKPLREDIFHLRLLEDAVFLSASDVEPLSGGSELELERREVAEDGDGDDDEIQDILRVVETELSARIPSYDLISLISYMQEPNILESNPLNSERRLVIEYLRLKLLDHEAFT
ncbi:hypothetical protein BYT27DRAFT_6806143 [Phlegmacium glaucopus]|nr:hypothetical protein BYT27DRAFT_6806143 [Phlegmacium glaucopus]